MLARRCVQFVRSWVHFSGKTESVGTILIFAEPVDITQVLDIFVNTPKELILKGEYNFVRRILECNLLHLQFLLYSVDEDRIMDAMGQVILSWDRDYQLYVDSSRRTFIRPATMEPTVSELIVRLLFHPTFTVGSSSAVTYHHWRNIPFESWSEDVLMGYASKLLEELNFVHERHCTLELCSSSSSETCK
jgi:hypothetical protein